jgi:hypothetical protein
MRRNQNNEKAKDSLGIRFQLEKYQKIEISGKVVRI